MKTFVNQAAQGDCLIRRIDALPANIEPAIPEGAHHIMAHSETGHNHVIEADPENVRVYNDPSDPLKAYLEVLATDVQLQHRRAHDTHETINVTPGKYEIRRQREYMPEGFRRAAD